MAESREGLATFEGDVVALEAGAGDPDLVARMFRVIHTIKGTSGFLGLGPVGTLAHAGEQLLSGMRDGRVAATHDVAEAMLELADALRAHLAGAESGDGAPAPGDGVLVARLAGLAATSPATPPDRAMAPETAAVGPSLMCIPAAEDSVRVDVRLLDTLMNLADELGLVRHRIDEAGRGPGRADAEAVRHLGRVTADFQSEVMRLRMQRLATLWSRLPRMVRDMAAACGKQVNLELEGESIELDRTILEAIRDPLVHLLRNAVDHGLEAPAERRRAAKPPAGRLTLTAAYEGGRVRIEVADDGAGINLDAVRRRAVSAGLLAPDRADHAGEPELTALLFTPGFSTSEQVTALSGRGVGLDVVRTNVEHVGGSVTVGTRPGRGTTFTILLPLTVAVLPALTVTAGAGRYAIPMAGIIELLRWDEARDVEWIHATAFVRSRGLRLPLVRLASLLDRAGHREVPRDAVRTGAIAVLEAGERRFGLLVDAVLDAQDVVVKPRSRHLGPLPIFAGSTILADGRVALILDVMELAREARVGPTVSPGGPRGAGRDGPEGAEPLLLFRGPDAGRLVMPLAPVRRVERVPRSAIERSGALEVLQYRQAIVPLIRVAETLRERRANPRGTPAPDDGGDVTVVLLEQDGRQAGLVVERVEDIVRERLSVERPAGRDGVLGSAVVARGIAEVFDVEGALRRCDPRSGGAPGEGA